MFPSWTSWWVVSRSNQLPCERAIPEILVECLPLVPRPITLWITTSEVLKSGSFGTLPHFSKPVRGGRYWRISLL